MGMAISHVKRRVERERSTVSSKRWPISCETGRSYSKDRPKSPLTKLLTQIQYCM